MPERIELEISEWGRPIVYIADYYERCIPGVAVEGISNRCLFNSRKEAIRWVKFSAKHKIDWSSWKAPQGQYPYESARDDVRLTPTFIAEQGQWPEEPHVKVTVTKVEVCGEFNWWAKEADGDWNEKGGVQ